MSRLFVENAVSKKYLNNDPAPCPKCGKESIKEQVGHCVYSVPCGCRLGSNFRLIEVPVLKKSDQLTLGF
jgi:hypothetical protein